MKREDANPTEHLLDIETQAEHYYLRGWKIEAIARELGIGGRWVQKILRSTRKLVAEGEYDAELAKLKAAGFADVPTRESVVTKPGRPPVPLTDEERVMRAEYGEGVRIVEIARKHGTYAAKVRSILAKRPSVLTVSHDTGA